MEKAKTWTGNSRLNHSKRAADDEFYTRMEDIQKTMPDFYGNLKGKSIYMPCDNQDSNFVRYFKENQAVAGIERMGFSSLENGGDFLSNAVKARMLQYDVIITNPPYSRFKEFLQFLDTCQKDFLIVAGVNALHYRHAFEMIMQRRMFIHPNSLRLFHRPDGTMGQATSYWLTSFPLPDYPKLALTELYAPEKYPEYDNLIIIEVPAFKLIPKDYSGIMGVPASFLPKLNRQQFELLGMDKDIRPDKPEWKPFCKHGFKKYSSPILNGKDKYARIYIRHRESGKDM